ncbi:hypothetical protein C8R45DRAFT_1021463 [Mycena sanguinolenta]|nr:hypothetical protein C8R45DRAFT_1021463 [Mycena sanguinolenta]
MKFFGWDSPLSFETEASLVPANTFSNLVRLTVVEFDPSFLQVVSQMELPSLREADFSATAEGGLMFFQTHGEKLHRLTVSVSQIADPDLAIFQRCPSIVVLGIRCDEKTIITTSGFELIDKHMCLERIVFKLPPGNDPMRQKQRNSLRSFLTSLDVTPFPSLRQIEHPHCEWPTTDAEISRNQWVRWAESLLERNIQLVDEEGNHWRPRLKYVPGRIN